MLESGSVQLFAVGVEDALYPKNWNLLEDLTKLTGGEFFRTRVSQARLQSDFHKIFLDLSNQYVLAFSPSPEAMSGHFREIEIRVLKAGMKTKHRTGYALR